MPRPTHIPKYSLHKPSGQARVLIDGKHIYLGRHGSPESREQYLRRLAERHSAGAPAPLLPGSRFPDLSVNELMVRYIEFAQQYYVKDGKPTLAVDNIKYGIKTIRVLYSHASASDIGPKALKAVREHMISVEKLSRGVINTRINHIRRMFKWAVSEELVPPSVHEGLRAVVGLRRGRCDAREMEPVHPVDDATVNATLPYLPPQIADMIMLQRYTSMRPGDVVIMRPCDIDTSQPVWVYEPATHKTQYRGHRRLIPIGPRAQAIVRRYLDRRTDAYLFVPGEVETWRSDQRRQLPAGARHRCIRQKRFAWSGSGRPVAVALASAHWVIATTPAATTGPCSTESPRPAWRA